MIKSSSRSYPKLQFKINKKLDEKTAFLFWNAKAAGVDFGERIIQDHPFFKKLSGLNVEERINFIANYVNAYYSRNKPVLLKFLKKSTREWRLVEDKFFLLTKKIFANHPWPKGLYICYLSIFNCNPRFLENKTFQAYYRFPYGIKPLASHELIHFIFYDYLDKNFKKKARFIPENKIWTLSEVFNYLILNQPEFLKLTQRKPAYYPDHERLIKKLTLLWDKTGKIDPFLKKSLRFFSQIRDRESKGKDC